LELLGHVPAFPQAAETLVRSAERLVRLAERLVRLAETLVHPCPNVFGTPGTTGTVVKWSKSSFFSKLSKVFSPGLPFFDRHTGTSWYSVIEFSLKTWMAGCFTVVPWSPVQRDAGKIVKCKACLGDRPRVFGKINPFSPCYLFTNMLTFYYEGRTLLCDLERPAACQGIPRLA
jgi:hypothetical protein